MRIIPSASFGFHAKTCAVVVFLMLGFSTLAQAQEERRGQGYVFFAPGAMVVRGCCTTATAHVGFGGEALVFKGLGAGAEVGYFTPWRDWSAGIGILSLDGSYHFARSRRLSPFVSGGYSLAFRSGTANLVNFGGGVTYWFRKRTGLRLEFRDHFQPSTIGDAHYLSARIGFSFR